MRVSVRILKGELGLTYAEQALDRDYAHPVISSQGVVNGLKPAVPPDKVGQPGRHRAPDGWLGPARGTGSDWLLGLRLSHRARRGRIVSGEGLDGMPWEAGVDNATRCAIPVTFPIGDRPQLIRIESAFLCRRTTGCHECRNESPVRQVYPITIEDVTHGRASELVLAQTLQGGIARLAGPLPQLGEVAHEALRSAQLIEFHEVP